MNHTRLTRRGFISMLASVPVVAVAAPRIFLPESQRERGMRLYCEYVRSLQEDWVARAQLLTYGSVSFQYDDKDAQWHRVDDPVIAVSNIGINDSFLGRYGYQEKIEL